MNIMKQNLILITFFACSFVYFRNTFIPSYRIVKEGMPPFKRLPVYRT